MHEFLASPDDLAAAQAITASNVISQDAIATELALQSPYTADASGLVGVVCQPPPYAALLANCVTA